MSVLGLVVDVEALDVDNAGHFSATANDTEMLTILTSDKEVSQKIRQYIPTQTL